MMIDPASAEKRFGELRFAVIIPTYNHGGRVAAVARQAMSLGYPIFVVDDGSTDDTAARLRSVSGVHLSVHPHNRGKGAALVTGMRAAAEVADYAVTIDADGQHDPVETLKLMAAIPANRRVIVVGRREMADAPWTSRQGRHFSNFWVRVSGGPKLADSQSGFRIYPLPETLDLGVVARRYQFEVEVLARAAWQGIPVREATISAHYGSALPRISHFHPFVDFMRNFGAFSRLITRRVFTPALWSIGRKTK
ncbi:glycosyltransferase family 2 protein [Desulfosarcina sp.]|uniref:glycosyltransferase family 2 protein n=1 Tax=Desulfosarcina sp. TaxID=2027861 RepID=UPI0029B689EB|nr:glycosyltransferase family 2 protein [Desulfosarcina sp.]MDX2453035.1 glycosyltransferase family 2 protein [Desulfosarcina sp.]MDX2490767.1 glycosyltransferase family 2 protein [Desulfosarcina sp.]